MNQFKLRPSTTQYKQIKHISIISCFSPMTLSFYYYFLLYNVTYIITYIINNIHCKHESLIILKQYIKKKNQSFHNFKTSLRKERHVNDKRSLNIPFIEQIQDLLIFIVISYFLLFIKFELS